MRLEDSDWQGKTEGEGYVTWRSLNIGPSWVRFSVEFYEKLSLFGPEYRMWRVRPGSAALNLISRLSVEELGQLKNLKKIPWKCFR